MQDNSSSDDRVHDILETGPLQVNCQIIGSRSSGEAVLIDPGGDEERVLKHLAGRRLKPVAIVNTHGHFDHIGAVAAIKEATGCPFLLHADDAAIVQAAPEHAATWGLPFGEPPVIDRTIEDGETLSFNGLSLEVIHTPGHTPGGVCLLWDGCHVAVGDTLFAGSIGRTDLPGGNHNQLISSIRDRLLPLPDDTRCHPGHGPSTSVGKERRANPYLR
ncbi:MAG: MBL fold metallo-hydrolase [Magnetococcales bacterium]|nr:MBL fold metallo-hydrolase [Magnetococcales bacterium]